MATGQLHPRGELLGLCHFESVRMGTTVVTNALLERKGARSALFITKGLKYLLQIGNHIRPKIFDLTVARPDILYEKVVEVDERITMEAYTEDPASVKTEPSATADSDLVTVGRARRFEFFAGQISTLSSTLSTIHMGLRHKIDTRCGLCAFICGPGA